MIENYPGQPEHLLAIMQDVQKQYNYLPRLAISMIAEHVGIPVSRVYAMASFYKAFSLVPKGRYVFRVCDGTACHIKNSEVLLDQLQQSLGIGSGETTEDGMFSVETVNCLGACALAPVMVVNGKVYGKVTPGDVGKIIKEYGGQEHDS
ncbi:MAG TPA: NAD(P)H-dependent oxidoreductase subunit E [Syntrophomonadaceae bacterium]|nr:NAD(P)H-dependent oxidoreductase subunit E [Syntrophomonadaceae bacterium]